MKPCEERLGLPLLRRPANALNVEIGQPLDRCRLKTPEHWGTVDPRGARWLLSGGQAYVFGMCSTNCPKRVPIARGCGASAVARAVDAGLVVHVPHPNFRGTLTAGTARRADGEVVYEMIAHGCEVDVGDEYPTAIELGRGVVFQAGNRRAFWAATAKLEACERDVA